MIPAGFPLSSATVPSRVPDARDVERLHAARPKRRGFALALALFTVIVLTLLVALLFDAGVQDIRTARTEMAATRAQAVAEGALAALVSSRPDIGLISDPRGTRRQSTIEQRGDTARVALQVLGSGTVRVVVSSSAWSGNIRAAAGSIAFFRVIADSFGAPGALQFRRLPGWWWAPNP